MLTARCYIYALLCPGLLIAANFAPVLAPLGLLYGTGLLMVLLIDRHQAGDAQQFRITREHEPKLSLGTANTITISVRSRAQYPFELTIRDEPPHLFAGAPDAEGAIAVAPGEHAVFDYRVRPVQRGDFAFGNINIRWTGPLGLYTRQAVVPATETVKVYPNLYEIRKYDLLARRDQLAEMGLRALRQRGEGTAFESLRDYTTDDPYRIINWKATARRGKPISTDYEPERSQRVIIALDVGRTMRSPISVTEADGLTWNMAKADFVINSVLLFAYVATLKGDQVGLLVFADKIENFTPPVGGRAGFQSLLGRLYALQSQPVEADYGRALTFLAAQQRQRSLVTVFTDLSGARSASALVEYVPRLAPRHLPMVVTIRDPALDNEAEQQPVDSAATYRRAVAEQLLDERRLLLDSLRSRGVIALDVNAQAMTMAIVNRYLQIKAQAYL
jgi:uncharacterized protein (DUF58 family)